MYKKVLWFLFYLVRSVFYPLIPRRFVVKDVAGQNVLITGGGFGLGRLMAQRFAKLGARVIIWDVNKENMKATEDMICDEGGKCHSYACDVADSLSVYRTADRVRRDIGHVDILILNAGIVNGKPLLELSDERIKKCFDVNTLSHFWLIKAFLPFMMKANQGHIISIDSVSAFYGTYWLTDYCASKSASHRLQDALFSELKYSGFDGIKMTSIMPYFMNTGMFAGSYSKVFKILEPEYVADECVEAILRSKSVVLIPGIFHLLRAGTMMIPYKSYFAFHEAFFGGNMMSNFVGRSKDGQSIVNNNSCPKRSTGSVQ